MLDAVRTGGGKREAEAPAFTTLFLLPKVRQLWNDAGLMTSSQARTISGIAGLASLPVLGPLFRKTNKDESSTAVLLAIRPTLLDLPSDQFVTPAIWTGSETRPLTPL